MQVLDPSAFASADFKHLATCQMQHSLLKVALLLGVHTHFSCPVRNLAQLQQRGFYTHGNRPEPGAQARDTLQPRASDLLPQTWAEHMLPAGWRWALMTSPHLTCRTPRCARGTTCSWTRRVRAARSSTLSTLSR